MNKKKECCKAICANCTHFNKGAWFTPCCNAVDEQKLNCVTGQSETVYLTPEIINKNGDCPYYNESKQKVLWNKIKDLLEEYDREIFMKYHGDYTRWNEYSAMNNLRDVLNNERVWISDEDDDDYATPDPKLESHVIDKKKKKHWWQ